MKKIYLVALSLCLSVAGLKAQTFTEGSVGGTNRSSGNCGGVQDVNNDGYADIIILDQSKNLVVAYQQANGSFTSYNYGTVSNSSQWGMTVGDIDNDGWSDVMVGGSYDGVKVVNIDGFTSYTMETYGWADIFMQACSFADIDNDGFIDGFACHDDGHNVILHNDQNGSFTNGSSMIDMVFYPEVPGGNDNSGNYGVVWNDFDRDGDIDCFIAKCRQFINDPYDPRRTNVFLVNDGNNNYTDQADERGLINLEQSWTVDFGDVDNDGDFDCFLTTHSGTLEIYENDGFGYFDNITAGSGLEVSGFFLQGKMADFDNDGYLDVIHAGGNEGYYHNNGNSTWTLVQNTFDANDVMHSFQIGDLNHDGFLDLYATYGNNYVTPDNGNPNKLFINNTNNNNWVVFDLEGTISNQQAIGAVVEIHGSFGTQVRDVRSGESYGITNTNQIHFGIGEAESIDYALIYWPAGGVSVIENPGINTFHNVTEQACPNYEVAISVVGSGSGCPIDLASTGSFSNYIWSNAASTANTQAFVDGVYSVVVYDENGCGSVSNSIEIDVTEDPAPTMTIDGEITFCQGGTVTLTASEGASYLWSNGQVSQSIEVSEAGNYYVDVTGGCGTQRTDDVDVEVFSAPAPVANGLTIANGATADLTATGSNINWYDAIDAINPIATGNTYTTAPLTETTTYYVSSTTVSGGPASGGKTDFVSLEGNNLTNANFYLKFDAYEPFTLVSVKVKANTSGSRTIQAVDAGGNVIQEATVDVPQGESVVTLNFSIPAGTNMGLRGLAGSNPNLWRDKDLTNAFPFPYALGTSGAITGTNVNGADFDNYYYFFYDWQISTPQVSCESERVAVEVEVLVGVNELTGINELNIFPNPTSGMLNVQFNSSINGAVVVRMLDATGRVVMSQNINNAFGKQATQFDLNNMAAGVYQLELVSNGQTSTSKVIVE